jgi:hypothetical protein
VCWWVWLWCTSDGTSSASGVLVSDVWWWCTSGSASGASGVLVNDVW